jgi:hypothetical protein
LQAVLNTQELELNWFFFGRWILLDGSFQGYDQNWFLSDVGLGRFDLDLGLWTLVSQRQGLCNRFGLGHFIWTLDFGHLDLKRKKEVD